MNKIRAIKRLGQNFLEDEKILIRIADSAALDKDDVVLEIGAGYGNLTKHLCQKAKFVYAVEKDARLCKIASENLSGLKNVKIICGDILSFDFRLLPALARNLGRPGTLDFKLKVIGNLPYYITTPIIFHLLKQRQYISGIFITVQKEVAERIVASPGGKDYGILSCSVQFYSEGKILFNISKNAFYPKPKVDSAFIRLKITDKPTVQVKNEEVFFKVVKAAFNQRRKMLRSALKAVIKRDALLDILSKSDIDPASRAEQLSLADFAKIANNWQNV